MTLQDSLERWIVCPADKSRLRPTNPSELVCQQGHRFPVVAGIPVLLTSELAATHPYFDETLAIAWERARGEAPLAISTAAGVDTFVQEEIVKTHGNLYHHLKGRLPRYPIPELRLPAGEDAMLLDVGCNWGRWTLAAAQKGYCAIGLDPSLEACLAGQRVARQLGVEAAFIVGDARRLPFADGALDVVFSYSVLQHFAKADACLAVRDMARVTRSGGTVLAQMTNLYGLRQAYNRMRQLLRRETNLFRVRYWRPRELSRTFGDLVGQPA